MFERYTERARRVLFFARYEASQLGSISIETEHLLLGLIREGKGLTSRIFARSHLSLESIRKEIEGRTVFREKVSTSVEIPFSAETKRVLQFAAEEADRLLHNYIGTEHLLLGILREERSVAATILMEKGMRLNAVREDIVQLLNEKTTLTRVKETPLLAEFSRDLTEAAMKNQLDPLVGRDTSSSACSRCSAAARRTTPCSSASRASARRPSSRGSRRRSSTATCRTSSPTSASSRSTSR
jgi:ATP-dependent Clp protease ATP-binding subunit ClpC